MNWLIILIFLIALVLIFLIEHSFSKIKLVLILILILVIYFSWTGFSSANIENIKVIGPIYSYAIFLFDAGSNAVDYGKYYVKTVGNAIQGNYSEEDFPNKT